MREVFLNKTGLNKVKIHQRELRSFDFEGSLNAILPGQWCLVSGVNESWVGFMNSRVSDQQICAYLLTKISRKESEVFSPEKYIKDKIKKALQKRAFFSDYGSYSRVFYGATDGLPGLIIDSFKNASVIQINTAGVDNFRDLVKEIVQDLTKLPAYFLDNEKYRAKEFLPTFAAEPVPDIEVEENNLKYLIRSQTLQKIGFYYDHRENRLQLMTLLKRLKIKPTRGVDLFCYAGAWGITALSCGVEDMHFVDQGDFGEEVNRSLSLNNLFNKGVFMREDVFTFLDHAFKNEIFFDIVLCDPPAFAKSKKQKTQALEGYSKLHRKVFKVLTSQSLVAFSSCTHYVSHDEFQKNILDASRRENRSIQLLYSGMQGFDHPIESLSDKASYIKSYFYLVE